MVQKKVLVTVAVALTGVAAMAAPAGATHVHSKQLGNGSCVLVAQNGGEKDVELPSATGADAYAIGRRHPLHVLVHLGRAGENFPIGVYGTATDPCLASGDYVND